MNNELESSIPEIQKEKEKFEIKSYLTKYLELQENEINKIDFIEAKNLQDQYKNQLYFMHDTRLENIKIAIVPDSLWIKGISSSESHAEKNLILFKQGSFEKDQNDPNNIAWMVHELAHCQDYLDDKDNYEIKMQKPAFENLKSEYTYPNNQVEKFTFTKQFKYLKNKGMDREYIFQTLKKHYQPEDLPFFNRLLDRIYK